ncbi:hypothetical protein ABPG74_004051 [Tetrahymena malaccensis]
MIDNIKEIILHNILFLEQSSRKNKSKSTKSYLNKWFQDNVKTYIMKKIAAPLLLQTLKLKKTEEVQSLMEKSKIKNFPQYIGVIIAYFDMIILNGLEKQFQSNLFESLFSFPQLVTLDKLNDYNVLKKIRNSFVCALVYQFFNIYLEDKQNVYLCQSFFQIWNVTFPQNQITQRRKNQHQMEKALHSEIQKEKQTIAIKYNSSENAVNQMQFLQNEENIKYLAEQVEYHETKNQICDIHQSQQQTLSFQQNQFNILDQEIAFIDNHKQSLDEYNNQQILQQIEIQSNFEQEQCYAYENYIFNEDNEIYQQSNNYNYSNQYYGFPNSSNDIASYYHKQDFDSLVEKIDTLLN